MKNYRHEFEDRVNFIKNLLQESGCNGIVYGNSGGKDSALVGILCKAACENTMGIIMPCESKQNFQQDMQDALLVAAQFSIATKTLDLTSMKLELVGKCQEIENITKNSITNIAPRLRMTALYLIAQSRNALVAGTGNRCEIFMGYFTKWGDGAYDFNPIADLTVSEVYQFLQFLNVSDSIVTKAPSAGLFEGQTDEVEMGVSYNEIETYLTGEHVEEQAREIIKKAHKATEHKRKPVIVFEK